MWTLFFQHLCIATLSCKRTITLYLVGDVSYVTFLALWLNSNDLTRVLIGAKKQAKMTWLTDHLGRQQILYSTVPLTTRKLIWDGVTWIMSCCDVTEEKGNSDKSPNIQQLRGTIFGHKVYPLHLHCQCECSKPKTYSEKKSTFVSEFSY